MNTEQLLANLDRISEAPEAVTRLRRFILNLAVRGKLVGQNAGDEPALELLKRIKDEKDALIRLGKLKVAKDTNIPIRADEIPFALPGSWTWIRVEDAFRYDAGIKREPKELIADRWLLELEDIEKDTSKIVARLTVMDRKSLSTKSEFQEGDILYGKLRPYLNKVVVASEPGYSTTEIVAIRPFLPLCSRYCSLAFRRPDFVGYVNRLGQGTKMPRLRTPDALAAVFPLPPLPEQHRIVAKVDELMALCDRVEQAQYERESRRNTLVAASLHRLNNGAAQDAVRKHSPFYLNQLSRLTTRPEHIEQLRQTILNLAVRGHLVSQDANEDPASFVLERSRLEIKAYAHELGIQVIKPEPIEEKDVPCPPAVGWIWTRLGSLFKVITDGDHQPPPKSEDGVAFLTIGNITTGRLNFSHCRFVPESYLASVPEYRKPSRGDILYTVVGATYGRPVLVDTDRAFCVQRHIAILKPTRAVCTDFLYLLLRSPLVYEQATKSTTGAAQPTIPLRPLRNFLVPLPPLAEQRRIVAKSTELMAVCDRMESAVKTSQTTNSRLLETILHLALRPGPYAH